MSELHICACCGFKTKVRITDVQEANRLRAQSEAEVERLAKALATKQQRLDYAIKENTELIGLLSERGWQRDEHKHDEHN